MTDSHVYRFITHDILFGYSKDGNSGGGSYHDDEESEGELENEEGIIPYINKVLTELIAEALHGKPIDGKFGKNLRDDVHGAIRDIGN